MRAKGLTVAQLAREANTGIDETLIALWDAGMDYVNEPADLLRRGDTNRARRAVGLATRRELSAPEYWQHVLGVERPALEARLAELGVPHPFVGARLSSKAIQRLRISRRDPPPGLRSSAVAAEDPQVPALDWELIGHQRDLNYLTDEDVRSIHEQLVQDFRGTADPLEPSGVRSEQLLGSAVHRPQTSGGGELKYPTVELAAAALLHALVHDHPFHNGNKRTALVAMLVFLDDNHLVLMCDEEALFKLVLQLAQHAIANGPRHELPDREVLAVARWLKKNVRVLEKGDRALPWRKLKQILGQYGCVLSFPSTGNRINIERTIAGRSIFGRRKDVVIRTQTHYGDDGREVDKTAINKLRRDLQLDDDHGVDSAAFYDRAATSPSEFIVRYRKTLRRLARL